MKIHTKNYMDHFNLIKGDFIPCEMCGGEANDIHHINFKSQGGTNEVDNLLALCRPHHSDAHGRNSKTMRKLFLDITHKRENKY